MINLLEECLLISLENIHVLLCCCAAILNLNMLLIFFLKRKILVYLYTCADFIALMISMKIAYWILYISKLDRISLS